MQQQAQQITRASEATAASRQLLAELRQAEDTAEAALQVLSPYPSCCAYLQKCLVRCEAQRDDGAGEPSRCMPNEGHMFLNFASASDAERICAGGAARSAGRPGGWA